jgi:hypothetical protein
MKEREPRESKSGIERIVFLLLHALRDQIMQSDVLDKDDKLVIAKFYDDHRGEGW